MSTSNKGEMNEIDMFLEHAEKVRRQHAQKQKEKQKIILTVKAKAEERFAILEGSLNYLMDRVPPQANNPRIHPNCDCDECRKILEMESVIHAKKLPEQNPNDRIMLKTLDKFYNANDYDFMFILHRLQPMRMFVRSNRLVIPDCVGFSKGEPIWIAYTATDERLRYIKQKERLFMLEIEKFLKVRKKKREFDVIIALGQRLIPNEEKNVTIPRQTLYHKGGPPPNVFASPDKAQIFKRVVDVASSNREGVLFHYRDGASQLMSEFEFHNFIQKRTMENMREIHMIQSFVYPKTGGTSSYQVDYLYDRVCRNELFEKSLHDIRFIAMESVLKSAADRVFGMEELQFSTEDEDEFENTLIREDTQRFCEYKVYKIANYIEAFHGLRIISMRAEFTMSEDSTLYLTNCRNVRALELTIPQGSKISFINLVSSEHREAIAREINQKPIEHEEDAVQELHKHETQQVMNEQFQNVKRDIALDYDYYNMNDHIERGVLTSDEIHPDGARMLARHAEELEEKKRITFLRLQSAREHLLKRPATGTMKTHSRQTSTGGIPTIPSQTNLKIGAAHPGLSSHQKLAFASARGDGPSVALSHLQGEKPPATVRTILTPQKFFEIATNCTDERKLKFFKPTAYAKSKATATNFFETYGLKTRKRTPSAAGLGQMGMIDTPTTATHGLPSPKPHGESGPVMKHVRSISLASANSRSRHQTISTPKIAVFPSS